MNKVRNAQLVSAIVFMLMAVSFNFNDEGIWWMWRDNPTVGAILAAISLVFWVFFVRRVTKARRSEGRG